MTNNVLRKLLHILILFRYSCQKLNHKLKRIIKIFYLFEVIIVYKRIIKTLTEIK